MINLSKKVFTGYNLLYFIVIPLLVLVFIFKIFSTVIIDYKKLPSLNTIKRELAMRGNIYSEDDFTIASSNKLYEVSFNTKSLNIDNKDLFITLFSLYSEIDEETIRTKINKSLKRGGGYLILSRKITARNAPKVRELNQKLSDLNMFISLSNGLRYNLSIRESGEDRFYSYKDILTPVIGYVRDAIRDDGTKIVNGIKGLEQNYNIFLETKRDGIRKGKRDVNSRVIFNGKSKDIKVQNGVNIVLNIPLTLQKNIELILDKENKKFKSDEIISAVMDSHTGKIISMGSSRRFNPNNISTEDIQKSKLSVRAIEHQFEPGSIIKPISISLVHNKGRIKKDELWNASNKGRKYKTGEYPKGRYKLGRYIIRDDHQFKKRYLTLEDIFIYSSNIGTLQIAQRLSGPEFLEGYHNFGFSKKTGIDLKNEKRGRLKTLRQLSANDRRGGDNVFKATLSYGQGMTATFLQVLKAYTVFNNDGKIVTPSLTSHFVINNQKIVREFVAQPQVISKNSANFIKKLLIKTVEKGTGTKTKTEGLEIGGKTGTANIAKRKGRGYQRKYISSFFGFVNDSYGNSYTIGVSVFNPNTKGTYWYHYYASHSAVPVFKQIIDTLVKLNYLKPSVISQ